MIGTDNTMEHWQADRIYSPAPPPSGPIPGDVLASRPTARADLYWISVVPHAANTTARRYAEAIDDVREFARQRRVDGWFTCDHTHYARIAHYRS
jgi:hypothetical protein